MADVPAQEVSAVTASCMAAMFGLRIARWAKLAGTPTWLQDGYGPQNEAVMTAGEAGARVGATGSGS